MTQFSVERKILKLFGATIQTYNPERQILCRADQKAFKLKEQIQFYADDAKTQPIFSIKARKIIDISATYDIFGPDGVTVIASMRREGISSLFVRDQWEIMNAQGQVIANVREDTQLLGLLRRQFAMVALIAPQKYAVTVNQQEVATFQQNRNPFTLRFACEYANGIENQLGQALVYAIPNMLAIIEGKQS